MKLESILQSATTCFLTLALSTAALSAAFGQDRVIGVTRDDESQSRKAAQMFKEIMKTPDKGIPQNVFDRAECVAAFPGVRRAGSVVSGRGMISCRTSSGWSAPVYLNMRGDNLGSQMGAGSNGMCDMVMMFMNKDSMISMLNTQLTIGAGAPAAAGPVGQDAGAANAAMMNARMICYMRAKGMLAGAMMDGAMIGMAADDMRDVYGDNFNCKEILEGAKTNSNSKVMAFSEMLSRHTSRQARK